MSPKRTISRGKCFLCGETFKIVSFILNLMLSKIEGPIFNINKTPPDLLIATGLYRSGHPDAAIRVLGFFDLLRSLGDGKKLKNAVKFGPVLFPAAFLAASCVAKPPAEVRPATPTPTPPFTLTPIPTETPTPTPTATPEPPPTATPTATPEPSPTPTATETAIPPEERPLDLAGFNEVWNPNTNRFEYVDVDQQVIAYWDQGNKRVELAEGLTKLDLEKHKGLFVGWSADDALSGFQKAQKEGKNKMAFAFEPVAGRVEEIKLLYSGLRFYDIPPGTIFRAPFSGSVEFLYMSNGKVTIHVVVIISKANDLSLHYLCPSKENYIGSGYTIEAGDKIVYSTEKKINDFGQPNLFIILTNADMTKVFDLTLSSLLKDSSGRIVYIKPN